MHMTHDCSGCSMQLLRGHIISTHIEFVLLLLLLLLLLTTVTCNVVDDVRYALETLAQEGGRRLKGQMTSEELKETERGIAAAAAAAAAPFKTVLQNSTPDSHISTIQQ